jgi:membrane protease YdiL (CAAX protease family)
MEPLDFGLRILFEAVIFSPLLLLCKKDKRVYVLLFILISSLNEIVLVLGKLYFKFFPALHWNWSGKILSIVISAVFIIILKKYFGTISNNDFKISLGHKVKGVKAILFSYGIFLIVIVIFYILKYKQSFNLEELFFQLTMPGLDEELSFRGIYLALLNMAFIKRYKFLDAKFGMGLIIVSIQFGLAHGLSIGLGQGISFDVFNFVWTGAVGFGLGLLAESTGSLILPIVSHNIFNVINLLVRVFR